MHAKWWMTLSAAIAASGGRADPAVVEAATLRGSGETYRVSVTLRHADTGWNDYADGWRVELSDGSVLGTRELLHPHVHEQPFTRTLTGVAIPSGTGVVFIRARTLTEGWGKDRFRLDTGADD